MNQLDQQVAEILRNFGSKERFSGVVDHYDNTTLWIRGDDGKFYLAFTADELGFQPGDLVSFRKDGQFRAKDIVVTPV